MLEISPQTQIVSAGKNVLRQQTRGLSKTKFKVYFCTWVQVHQTGGSWHPEEGVEFLRPNFLFGSLLASHKEGDLRTRSHGLEWPTNLREIRSFLEGTATPYQWDSALWLREFQCQE